MRTNNEKFIEIQNILTISDVHPADCNKILDLIIELSKEKKQPKAYTNHNYDKAKQSQQKNNQLRLINKEHQQINGELRQANKLLNEQYIRLYKDYMQLKAQIEEYQKALDETQQKEFIKYLKDEIKLEIQKEIVSGEITNKRYILSKILQKYKSITGTINE